MNKLINISLCFILTLNFGYSQSIKRNVISSFGASYNTTSTKLVSTFGQPSNIGTITDGNYFIRQGFQQPFYNILMIPGCTDPLALNYDPNALIDDGSCSYCNNDTSYTSITSCDSVVWNGTTYSSSGTYSYIVNPTNTNYSMSFDGMDDYVDFSNPSDFDFLINSSFSLSFNIYSSSNSHHILSFGDEEGSYQNRGIFIGIDNNTLTAKIRGNQSDPFDTDVSFNINQNQYYDVTLVRDYNNILTLWVDGDIVDSQVDITGLANPFTDYRPLLLGVHQSYPGPNNTDHYNGLIDEFSIWNIVLDSNQINSYLNCPPNTNENGLIGYWNFEEGTGNSVLDQTSNGNNGTINGATYDSNVSLQSCNLTNVNSCDSVAILDLIIGISGCTDVIACNYDANSTCDDGSCLTDYGCTDPTAINYNANATCDDGSCIAALLPCSDLFISEYIEGLGPNNALEIYNSTNNIIDLSDYQLERYRNGDTNSLLGGVTQLIGSLMPGDAWVVTNGDTLDVGYGSISPVLYSLGDQAPPDGSYPTPLHMSGDDAILLTKITTGEIIDVIGKIGEDPGEAWGDENGTWWTKDQTLIRKVSVTGGFVYDATQPYSFDPTLEWDSLPQNTFTELGQHSCNCNDVSINEFESVINLYPNPNKSGLLNIESTSPIQEINIYNLIGQSVFSKNFQGVMLKESITIDPSLNGVYFMSVKLENNKRSLKKLILK